LRWFGHALPAGDEGDATGLSREFDVHRKNPATDRSAPLRGCHINVPTDRPADSPESFGAGSSLRPWRNLLRALLTAIGTICKRIGWKGVGVLLSVAIAAIAFVALTRALKGIDLNHVGEALRQTPPMSVALAAMFTALSYLSLTLYDFLALRMIGRPDIPYRIAALASFTSYPIAHGTGAVLPVSTAIRYRVYAPHGIGPGDVARICFLTGLTFWLGNLTALGLSVAYAPDAISLITQISPEINRMLAVAMLVAIAGFVSWSWTARRKLGGRRWSVPFPSGRSMFMQIGIGIIDLGAAALAIYVLIPVSLDIGLARVTVVLIAATLLGFASHAPAGIGVFDAIVLVGLGVEHKEPLLAVLLLFRLFYHLLPFMLALAIFATLETWRGMVARRAAQS
jgi:glycosyltransferase 2 family protein